jgi:hypothetical protein
MRFTRTTIAIAATVATLGGSAVAFASGGDDPARSTAEAVHHHRHGGKHRAHEARHRARHHAERGDDHGGRGEIERGDDRGRD